MIEIISSCLIGLGAIFQFLSFLGLLRFPNFLTRLHSSSKSTTLGVSLTLLGSAVYLNQQAVYFKAGLALIFLFLTAPVVALLFAKVDLRLD